MEKRLANSTKKVVDKVGKGVEIMLLLFLIVYCISLLVPLLWMIINSLKQYDDYILHSFQLPLDWTFENYADVFDVFKVRYIAKSGNIVKYDIWTMAGVSIIWTFSVSFLHVFVTSMCAYVIARYNFRGKNFLYSLGIFIMIIPIVGSLPSAMMLKKSLHIYNNMTLLLLTSPSAAFSGLHFLLLHAAFKRVPKEYSEVVFVDGGSHYTAFFKVIFPMIIPSAIAVFVLQFLATWSDYNTFIIWLPSYPSLSVGLYLFEQYATKENVTMPVILASFVVVIIPTTILYIATQKVLMSKFTVGGLKG